MGLGDTYVEQQALTRTPSPPNATSMSTVVNDTPLVQPGNPQPGDGLRVTSALAIVVSCWANSGQTLLGAGTLQCWVLDGDYGAWGRAPDMDLSLDWGGVTAQQGRIWAPLRNVSRLGTRILYLTNLVGVSGGSSDVQVRIKAFRGSFPS